jgi:hypothetical protein
MLKAKSQEENLVNEPRKVNNSKQTLNGEDYCRISEIGGHLIDYDSLTQKTFLSENEKD